MNGSSFSLIGGHAGCVGSCGDASCSYDSSELSRLCEHFSGVLKARLEYYDNGHLNKCVLKGFSVEGASSAGEIDSLSPVLACGLNALDELCRMIRAFDEMSKAVQGSGKKKEAEVFNTVAAKALKALEELKKSMKDGEPSFEFRKWNRAMVLVQAAVSVFGPELSGDKMLSDTFRNRVRKLLKVLRKLEMMLLLL